MSCFPGLEVSENPLRPWAAESQRPASPLWPLPPLEHPLAPNPASGSRRGLSNPRRATDNSQIWSSKKCFLPHRTACGILVPQQGIKSRPLAVEARSPNHWATKEVPWTILLTLALLSEALKTRSWSSLSDVRGVSQETCSADIPTSSSPRALNPHSQLSHFERDNW